jgi:Tfp pilus assembly protein PilV
MKKQTPVTATRGFTLIVTISLLVLLLVIGIGVLSLSAITLRGTTQSNA